MGNRSYKTFPQHAKKRRGRSLWDKKAGGSALAATARPAFSIAALEALLTEEQRLEFVTVTHRHAATRSVNPPTNAAISLVPDVFEINEDFRAFAEAEGSAQAD
jgi:hypothetical protein